MSEDKLDPLLTVRDVAVLLRLCEREIREMLADGRLRAVHLRGVRAVRVRESAVRALIADRLPTAGRRDARLRR
jgi:excisionase family DNA binding protein